MMEWSIYAAVPVILREMSLIRFDKLIKRSAMKLFLKICLLLRPKFQNMTQSLSFQFENNYISQPKSLFRLYRQKE